MAKAVGLVLCVKYGRSSFLLFHKVSSLFDLGVVQTFYRGGLVAQQNKARAAAFLGFLYFGHLLATIVPGLIIKSAV